MRLAISVVTLLVLVVVLPEVHGDHGYGHHGGHGHGTACIVKGSYCSCHYCKCEKGHVKCKGHGGYGHHHGHHRKKRGYGKKYCYGGTHGEHCHCDYCKCKHGYGHKGYGGCKGHR